MKNICSIVKDLIPLYAEDLTSEETAEFVREHIDECENCRKELDTVNKPAKIVENTNVKPMKKIKRTLALKRLQAAVLTAIFVLTAAVAVFAFISAPEYLPYSEETISVTDNENGSVTVIFPENAANYSCSRTEYEEYVEYSLESWTSILERRFSSCGIRSVTVSPQQEKPMIIRYVQNNGQEDVLLYSDSEQSSGGVITLPRLVLNYYIVIAVLVFIILMIMRLIVRKKGTVRSVIGKLMLIPISYVAGHFLVMGLGGITYSAQRDFALIMIIAILIYCGLLLGKSILDKKKENRITSE